MTMDNYNAAELQGLVKQVRSYLEHNLGFSNFTYCQLTIGLDSYQWQIDANDEFQSKLSYSDRIGRFCYYNSDKTIEKLQADIWDKLVTHMKRDERELRFGLKMLGDALEGDQSFNSEVGKMIAERIRAVRDDISAKFLPAYQPEAAKAEIDEALPQRPISDQE